MAIPEIRDADDFVAALVGAALANAESEGRDIAVYELLSGKYRSYNVNTVNAKGQSALDILMDLEQKDALDQTSFENRSKAANALMMRGAKPRTQELSDRFMGMAAAHYAQDKLAGYVFDGMVQHLSIERFHADDRFRNTYLPPGSAGGMILQRMDQAQKTPPSFEKSVREPVVQRKVELKPQANQPYMSAPLRGKQQTASMPQPKPQSQPLKEAQQPQSSNQALQGKITQYLSARKQEHRGILEFLGLDNTKAMKVRAGEWLLAAVNSAMKKDGFLPLLDKLTLDPELCQKFLMDKELNGLFKQTMDAVQTSFGTRVVLAENPTTKDFTVNIDKKIGKEKVGPSKSQKTTRADARESIDLRGTAQVEPPENPMGKAQAAALLTSSNDKTLDTPSVDPASPSKTRN